MLPELGGLIEQGEYYFNDTKSCRISPKSKVYSPYHLYDCKVGDYTYISMNSRISMADIGKFCSIGPGFVCGHGVHPTDGVSTSPMFYSTMKQNGMTLSHKEKIQERKRIHIGNDVFIGMGVTVLDGVTIGDGAVIGAGAVVSKDIPPYAIAVGCPIRIIRYRFDEETIQQFLHLMRDGAPEKEAVAPFMPGSNILRNFVEINVLEYIVGNTPLPVRPGKTVDGIDFLVRNAGHKRMSVFWTNIAQILQFQKKCVYLQSTPRGRAVGSSSGS